MFDFSTVGPERMWLKNLLLSETETESEISDVDEYIHEMLKNHLREKKIREKYNDSSQVSKPFPSSSALNVVSPRLELPNFVEFLRCSACSETHLLHGV